MQVNGGAELLARSNALSQLALHLLVSDINAGEPWPDLQHAFDELAENVTMLVKDANERGADKAEAAMTALIIAAWGLRYVLAFMDDTEGESLTRMVQG